MRLSLQLGCPPALLEQQLTTQDLQDFLALYQLEPWGFKAADYHASLISQTVANYAGRADPPCAISEFQYRPTVLEVEEPPAETDEEIEQEIRLFAGMFGTKKKT